MKTQVMLYILPVLTVLVALLSPTAALSQTIEGEYLEVRTCDVYTGPCFANAEVNETGKEATLAWNIRSGVVEGVDLAGLRAAAIVRANATLGDPYRDPAPSRSILFLDERADEAQRGQLRSFVLDRLGKLAGEVLAERSSHIELAVANCAKSGCATLGIGDEVSVSTRCIGGDDHVCGNEVVFYPPLTEVTASIPAVAVEHAVQSDELNLKFTDRGSRGAFTASFAVTSATAPESGSKTLRIAQLERGSVGDDAEPSVPDEVSEPFAKLLDADGFRVVLEDAGAEEKRGKPLYDFWLRSEIPLVASGGPDLQIRFSQLPLGAFVGVVKSYGQEYDYRDNPIEEGVYALRYAVQPSDGNHLGTAETRDFLVLTSFEDDTDPAPIAAAEDLEEQALMASSTDHPMVLYLVEQVEQPEQSEQDAGDEGRDAHASRRVVRHATRDEWIVESVLKGRAEGSDELTDIPLGIVVVGMSEHF